MPPSSRRSAGWPTLCELPRDRRHVHISVADRALAPTSRASTTPTGSTPSSTINRTSRWLRWALLGGVHSDSDGGPRADLEFNDVLGEMDDDLFAFTSFVQEQGDLDSLFTNWQ
jgi:hypothetical protein